jgi:acylphosphatase
MTENIGANNPLKDQLFVQITGRVQGVWYRGWTVEAANQIGIEGWVANRPDGSVHALFVGSNKQIQDMISACTKGPELSDVRAIRRIDKDVSVMPEYRAGEFYNAGNY